MFRNKYLSTSAAAASADWLSAYPLAQLHGSVAGAVTAIRLGRVSMLPGGHLHLDGAIWPCATNSELFVRECYEPLFDSILGKLLPAISATRSCLTLRERRFVVAGQPGIGKSVLAWYVIYRLLTEQPSRAIYHLDDTDCGYLILPGEPVRLCSRLQMDTLRNLEVFAALDPVFVCDSFMPPTPPYPCVVLSSPGRLARAKRQESELFKHYVPWLYMPVPTKEEVLELRALAFKDEPEALVNLRMDLWGPIPRLALVSTSMSEQRRAWANACDSSLHELVLAAKSQLFGNSEGDKSDAPHRLVVERCRGQDAPAGSPASNMHNPAYYDRGAVVFASAPMAHYVINRMVDEQNWNAAFLVDATARIAVLGALRGLNFETVALAALAAGGTFQHRKLLPPRKSKVPSATAPDIDMSAIVKDAAEGKATKAEKIVWPDLAELSLICKRHALLVPANRSNAGLDGLVWVPTLNHHALVDATISKRHGLHQTGAFNAVMALGWTITGGWPVDSIEVGSTGSGSPADSVHKKQRRNMSIQYYWAVPEGSFYEGWVTWQAAKKGSEEAVIDRHLVQYAICIPSRLVVGVAKAALSDVPTPDQLLTMLEEKP
jgi:hypothetical protein